MADHSSAVGMLGNRHHEPHIATLAENSPNATTTTAATDKTMRAAGFFTFATLSAAI